MQVDVTVTAKADQPWLWGVQSAVEAIFITQAKDDILSYLEYSARLFKELHAMQQASLSHLSTPGDHKLKGLGNACVHKGFIVYICSALKHLEKCRMPWDESVLHADISGLSYLVPSTHIADVCEAGPGMVKQSGT